MTDPGTMVVYYEGPAELARQPTPRPPAGTRFRTTPSTDATTEVRYVATSPTWQQLRLTMTGPDGAAVPVSTYRSTARYDATPG
jgi:hypothetical protein